MELIKDYDCLISYHPRKANVVADALSRKSMGLMASMSASSWLPIEELKSLNVELEVDKMGALLASLRIRPMMVDRIRENQDKDEYLLKLKEGVKSGKPMRKQFRLDEDGVLMLNNRICVPKVDQIRVEIMEESHCAAYALHPGSSKMYRNLRESYWWPGMKNDVATYVSKCLVCQQIKAEHQVPMGVLQPLPIPEWKWEHITMDFVTGLPRSQKQHDAIWVIVDRLTKSVHFIPVNVQFSMEKLAKLFVEEIVRYHGVPVSIVSDRDPRFTSRFWKSFQEALGTKLKFSSAYHPQTDGQSERTIQVLEDLLRASVMDFFGSWEDHLALAEFAYNNSYQTSIGMAPYKALYGRRCRTPAFWDVEGQRKIYVPEMVQDVVDKVELIKKRLKAAQDRQVLLSRRNRREREFHVGDKVFLKISPWKGVLRFGKRGKLSPRYIGPYEIIQKIGPVAYRLALPPALSKIHDVFHISMLKKSLLDDSQVLETQPVELREDLTYKEEPVAIMDYRDKELRGRVIKLVKVLWRNQKMEEATWEREDEMRASYPHLFQP